MIDAADVHVARELGRGSAASPTRRSLLAAALAVRGPRLGHVHVDLARIRDTAAVDAEEPIDLAALPWPEPEAWVARVGASPLVDGAATATDAAHRPPAAAGRDVAVPGPLLGRGGAGRPRAARAGRRARPRASMTPCSPTGWPRLFAADPHGRQALAAATAVRRRFAVVAGGPGTGKTTTVARIVALLCEQAAPPGTGTCR